MKAVIFGANGQDGFYLRPILEEGGYEVIATSRSSQDYPVDVANYADVAACIRGHRPQSVFNLAGLSATRHDHLFEFHSSIATGSLNVLEAVYRFSPETKVFMPGSGLMFQNTGAPIREEDPFEPRNPYSVARIHAVYAARYYRRLGLNVYVGYLFNHDSPRRSIQHLNRRIIEDVKEIKAGRKQTLEIGDLQARKEFGYAKEIMEGAVHLTRQSVYSEAVIGTGEAFTVLAWIEAVFDIAGIPFSMDFIIPNDRFKSEYEVLVSAPERMEFIGWKHKTSLYELAEMMYHKSDLL